MSEAHRFTEFPSAHPLIAFYHRNSQNKAYDLMNGFPRLALRFTDLLGESSATTEGGKTYHVWVGGNLLDIAPSQPNLGVLTRAHAKGSYSLKHVFFPSKFLLEGRLLDPLFRALTRALPPSKSLGKVPSKNPSWNLLESSLENLLRTLLRSVLLHDPSGVHIIQAWVWSIRCSERCQMQRVSGAGVCG